MERSRFWTAWFNAGVLISIILLPIAVIIILKMTFNMWLAGASSDTSSGVILEPMVHYKNKDIFKILFNNLQHTRHFIEVKELMYSSLALDFLL